MENLNPDQKELFKSNGNIEEYSIIKPIGKGKFSIVYRAERKIDGVLVALKKIGIFDLMDAKAREKTLKEVRLVQSVNHENIIQYLDAFLDGNELCIVFEWAEAGDLKRQIRKAREKDIPFHERIVWKYFSQLCDAVEYMHDKRIMHRDIKPANIFLTLQGVVKVGDLGLGRYLSEDTVQAHSKVGTPLYMAPEVLKGTGYDWKSDIWSLGCILYELANLKSPFKAEGLDMPGLFKKINKCDFKPLSNTYSMELRNLVNKMISLNPELRPNIADVCAIAKTLKRKYLKDAKASLENTEAPSRPSSVQSTENTPRDINYEPGANIALMELILSKLQVLRYEQCKLPSGKTNISSIYFAIDTVGMNETRQDKYHDFVFLASWLLETTIDIDEQPLTSAKRLLVHLESAGFPNAEMPVPLGLTKGFGQPVCLVLNWLCDFKLQKHTWKPVLYPVSEYTENIDDCDEDSIVMENALQDNSDEDHAMLLPNTAKNDCSSSQEEMIKATIPIADWRLECERVYPKLQKMKSVLARTEQQSSWFGHLRGLCQHAHTIRSQMYGNHCKQQILSVCEMLLSDLEKCKSQENMLNRLHIDLCQEYKKAQTLFESKHVLLQETQDTVMQNSLQLSTLTSNLDSLNDKLSHQTNRVSDVDPLCTIRQSYLHLVSESKSLECRICILSSQLFRLRIHHHPTKGDLSNQDEAFIEE